MKFEFCGRLDCPDWILAQLFHASQMSIDVFEELAKIVSNTIVAGGQVDEAEMLNSLNSLTVNQEAESRCLDPSERFADSSDIDDVRACFAAVHYIITNARQFKVSAKQLETELEQLGLPGDHCLLLCHIAEADS